MDDRAVLTEILFGLRSGISWRMLPQEICCRSGVTCWRRLREWSRRGVWKKLYWDMLERMAAADQADWSRAAVDSRSVPAKKGAPDRPELRRQWQTGLEAASYGRPPGIPLAIEVSAASLHDSRMLEPMLDGIPPLRTGRRSRPQWRLAKLHADKGNDYLRCRTACQRRKIRHRIARKGIESKTLLGRHRGVVERTFAWIARYLRLTIRYEQLVAMHCAFLHIGCALICRNDLHRL